MILQNHHGRSAAPIMELLVSPFALIREGLTGHAHRSGQAAS